MPELLNKRKYIGRCDICGANMYDTDATVTVRTGIDGMEICRNCCVVNYLGKKCDIVDLIEDSHLWAQEEKE